MKANKADIIVDLQFGSTGKGLLAGYLAETVGYDLVVNANMPNAGHTYIDGEGRKFIHKVLPSGINGSSTKYVCIGPGSVFDPLRLIKEVNEATFKTGIDFWNKLVIHEHATCLADIDVSTEKYSANLINIGSTSQGSAQAMIRKIQRQPDFKTRNRRAMDDAGIDQYVISASEWQFRMFSAESILIEGAQGFSLGINEEFYPYCTSRDCSPARFFSDCAVPVQYLRNTYGSCRTFPIRVGGTSGGVYRDQIEYTWNELKLEPEITTVTGRERRIFSWSPIQYRRACRAMCPDYVFLNFANYCSQKGLEELIKSMKETYKGPDFLGYGPTFTDVEKLL